MTLNNEEIQASTTLGSFFKYLVVVNGTKLEFANTQHEVDEIKRTEDRSMTIDVYETLPRTSLSRKGKGK